MATCEKSDLYAGDLCPNCRWILTLVDFSLGRCGHCLRAVPINHGAIRELAELKAAGPDSTKEENDG